MRCFSAVFQALTFVACIPSAFAAGSEADCPITQAPAQPFVPPPGYSLSNGSFVFWDSRTLGGSESPLET